jgi:broad specificity phosphatase PhoE
MLRLFLIRHGQTDYNLRNIVQGGGIDSDLNQQGRDQANQFFHAWKSQPFKSLYSSKLRRTHQTLAPFTDLGHQVTHLPEINELNWGIIEGKEATAEVQQEFLRINERWNAGDIHARVEDGESPAEAWSRIEAGLQTIIRSHPQGGNVLVCTHGRLMRILLAGALRYGLHNMNLFPHENTALNVLCVNRAGKYRVERLNDTQHLPTS